MAEYHYRYDPPVGDPRKSGAPAGGSQPGRGSGNPRSDGGDSSELAGWLGVGAAFAIGLWPLGVFLLIRKLIRTPNAVSKTAARSKAAQMAGTSGGRKDNKVSPSAGRGFLTVGSILTGVFFLLFLSVLGQTIASSPLRTVLSALAVPAGFLGIGLFLLGTGVSVRRQARRFLQYLGLIGKRESVRISLLTKATGKSQKRVCADLQEMLDQGILPQGYLDLEKDLLVLSDQGIADRPDPQEEKPDARPAQEPEADDNAILSEIRAVNDAIPDPVMSAKIDRIGELTGKILDHQRQHPDRSSQVRSFLNYYLPTTLKLLRAYAQLDSQGVEGENISTAKRRVEGMMDKVVEGFEKQLDKLFQNDAMDIASDVDVLEKMLDKDGLGGDRGMTLGI